MGADSLCIIGVTNEFSCRELTEAVSKSARLPVSVSATEEKIADIALDAGAKSVEVYKSDALGDDCVEEADRVRQDAGYPPMVYPISFTIAAQAIRNIYASKRYETVGEDFKDLVLGKFGKLPAPLAPEFISEICGNEPLVLVRPADLLEPEYDRIREYTAPWLEGEEDILTYALYRGAAIVFFEKRKAKKYALDMPHAHKHKGIHVV
jgi:oxaloacetate decarboxylase alpha subunit